MCARRWTNGRRNTRIRVPELGEIVSRTRQMEDVRLEASVFALSVGDNFRLSKAVGFNELAIIRRTWALAEIEAQTISMMGHIADGQSRVL